MLGISCNLPIAKQAKDAFFVITNLDKIMNQLKEEETKNKLRNEEQQRKSEIEANCFQDMIQSMEKNCADLQSLIQYQLFG